MLPDKPTNYRFHLNLKTKLMYLKDLPEKIQKLIEQGKMTYADYINEQAILFEKELKYVQQKIHKKDQTLKSNKYE